MARGSTEAEIVRVLVGEGEVVAEDAPLLEVETDKAQVEIPSPMADGWSASTSGPGQTVKVGAPLVSFAANRGAAPARRGRPPGMAGRPPPAGRRAARAGAGARRPRGTRGGPVPAHPGDPTAAPAELGVDCAPVPGTGPGGA